MLNLKIYPQTTNVINVRKNCLYFKKIFYNFVNELPFVEASLLDEVKMVLTYTFGYEIKKNDIFHDAYIQVCMLEI